MAVKPIIDIDIDSSEFDAFNEKWKEYQKSIGEMPKTFQDLNKRVAEFQKLQMAAGVDAGAALAAAIKLESVSKKLGHSQQSNAVSAERSAKAFKNMSKDVLNVGKGILHITKSLMKWGGIIGGIGVGAGLFGLDKLANSAMGQQRSARGSGLSIGQQAALKINLSRFFSPEAVATSVANAQQNYSKWGEFAALGLNPGQVAQESTFNATLQVAQAAKAAWQQYHNASMPQIQAAQALGFSIEDLRRMSAPGYAKAVTRVRGDVSGLGISDKTASEWSHLAVQLSRAGQEIENTLINGLAPLAPDFENLSKAINVDLIDLLKSKTFKTAIDDAAKNIGQFAKFLGSENMQENMKIFAASIGQLAHEVVRALRYFHLIPQATPKFHTLAKAAKIPVHPSLGQKLSEIRDFKLMSRSGALSPSRLHAINAKFASKYNVPLNIADRLTYAESSYGRNLISSAGALGPDQLMPPTAKALGVNPMNPKENIKGALEYLSILYKHYGSWNKAVAAYNWGPGNLDADISAHGKSWYKYAPTETQGEVSKVSGIGTQTSNSAISKLLNIAKQKHAQSHKYVTITNSTSSRVAVSSNSLVVPP